ncbi:MAG: DNA alkylation repair protein [Peptostreptococcaceae bacterium]|nr:DNA alkylation repair protein [Peptostreptococcaceae bacterium]
MDIKQKLFDLADIDYKKFQENLCPNVDNIIGVRIPKLRNLAKDIAKNDYKKYIDYDNKIYYEEIMLEGMIIGYIKVDLEKRLEYISNFVPKITNWAVCDSFCSGLKFTKDNKEEVLNLINFYLLSNREFEIRFAVVMLLNYYVDENHISNTLQLLDKIKLDAYYVKMGVAWAISKCFIKYPKITMEYLKNNSLDRYTYNKSLQKITESLKVDKETKNKIKNMKIK